MRSPLAVTPWNSSLTSFGTSGCCSGCGTASSRWSAPRRRCGRRAAARRCCRARWRRGRGTSRGRPPCGSACRRPRALCPAAATAAPVSLARDDCRAVEPFGHRHVRFVTQQRAVRPTMVAAVRATLGRAGRVDDRRRRASLRAVRNLEAASRSVARVLHGDARDVRRRVLHDGRVLRGRPRPSLSESPAISKTSALECIARQHRDERLVDGRRSAEPR